MVAILLLWLTAAAVGGKALGAEDQPPGAAPLTEQLNFLEAVSKGMNAAQVTAGTDSFSDTDDLRPAAPPLRPTLGQTIDAPSYPPSEVPCEGTCGQKPSCCPKPKPCPPCPMCPSCGPCPICPPCQQCPACPECKPCKPKCPCPEPCDACSEDAASLKRFADSNLRHGDQQGTTEPRID